MQPMLSGLVFLYALVACGAPLSRVMLGAVPLYYIDVLAVLLLLSSLRRMGVVLRRHRRMAGALGLFILALLPTSFAEISRMGLLEPTYMLSRLVLHALSLLSLTAFLRNPAQLKSFLAGAASGILITATVTIAYSLPMTGPWVRANVMQMEMLNPRGILRYFEGETLSLIEIEAQRGSSLIGNSNPTGAALCALLPFLIGGLRFGRLGVISKALLGLAIVLSIAALFATYSRAAYVGLAILLIAYLAIERRAFVRRFLPPLALVLMVVGFFGFQSDLFKFDFISDKFDPTNERYAGGNTARILSYTRPVQLLFQEPSYLLRGAGRTSFKLREENPDAAILRLMDNEMHSVFAASIFFRGFAAMAVLFYMYVRLTRSTWRAAGYSQRRNGKEHWFVSAALLSLLAMLPHWAFDHHYVSSISGHAHLFMFFALAVASLDYVHTSERSRRHMRDRSNALPEVPEARGAFAGARFRA